MLNVNNVSMQFSDRMLYDDVNLKFTPGNCYGVIGANGAGKSTFLKIIEGKLKPTTGTVSMGPNERMSSLNQDHFAFEDSLVMDTVIRGHKKLYDIMTEKNAIYLKPDFSDADGIRAAELETEFGEMGGWEAEAEASQMLQSLGIDESLHQVPMSELTEPQKVKVLLGQALFGHPDVLLLDEPTNGLDVQSISWLENFLAGYENTVIVVSHDRHFLNQVCTSMCDVDRGKITLFVGNYDFWMESSELATQLQANANAKKEEQIKQLQEFVARFSANASKSKQATSRKKQLEKITLDDIKPSTRKYPFIKFNPERELGKDLVSLNGISKSIEGVKILDNINLTLRPNEKIAFISRNDLTTTILMQIIAGEMEPDEGEVVWGQTATATYLPKNVNEYFADNKMSVIDWLRQYASKDENDNTFLRGFLGKMLFSGDDVNREVDVMSGGEKVRAMLSKMMLSKANVLLLDDPTNHLDLESITALNDGLVGFKGSIIFTSHDHEFIQTIANRIIEVSPKGIVDKADTTYDEFLGHKQLQEQVAKLYED